MRIESSVTSLSWIPLGAVEGANELAFRAGVAHYDLPPPDLLTDLGALLAANAFRFANELRAWVEVDGGRIVAYGHSGRGHIGATKISLGARDMVFPAVAFPDLRPDPEVRADAIRFVQTAGGRTGVAVPRRVRRPPFVQISAPVAWSTLALTIHADGSSEHEVVGASPFPRHWIFDHQGALVAKTGFIDYDTWYRESFGDHTPWGNEESPAVVTRVESALERQISPAIIGLSPPFRRLAPGDVLVSQGEHGDELFLLFDGVLAVEIDGQVVTEVGPGAVLGEMALLEGGRRTATLRAVTPCRVAVVPGDRFDKTALAEVARGRRRQDPPAPD
jgi:cyclic nucleotide-binding protein